MDKRKLWLSIIILLMISSISISIGGCFASGKQNKILEEIQALKEPISVSDVSMYRDGGTISVVLTDVEDRNFVFCVDGRMASSSAGNLFAYASHPSQRGAKMLLPGGDAEIALLEILQSWRNTHSSDEGHNIEIIDRVIGSVKYHRKLASEATAKGTFTKEEAVKMAKKIFYETFGEDEKYKKNVVHESDRTFLVTFVGITFEEDSKLWKSNINIRISKETREMLSLGASDVREIKR